MGSYSENNSAGPYPAGDWRTMVAPPPVERTGLHGGPLSVPSLTLPDFIRFAIALAVIPLLVDGLVPQLEMAFFDGGYPIRVNFYLFFGLLVFWAYLRKRFYSSELVIPGVLLGSYVLLDAVHLMANEGIPPGEILRSSLVAFAFLMFATVALSLRIGVSEKVIVRLILLMLLANFVVQLRQFQTNSPVLPEQARDMSWQVDTDVFIDGQQRAFGLFANGLDAGVFCAFTGALGVAYCRKFSRLPIGLSILAISAFGCYASYTRAPLIALVLSIITTFLLRPRFARFPIRFLPLVWGALAVVIIVVATASPFLGKGLENSTSTVMRMQGWFVCFQSFTSSSTLEKLLGSGIASGLHVTAGHELTKYVPFSIDNMFINLTLYFGLLCLVPACFLIWKAWRFLQYRAVSGGTSLQIAAAAFGSTIFFLGMYNNGSTIWAAVVIISALCVGEPEPTKVRSVVQSWGEGLQFQKSTQSDTPGI
jgi:hypothetical protein